jgi:exodeoxyribonuclease-3
MKLISFNINGIKSMTYKLKNGEKKGGPTNNVLKSLTEEQDPDILCFQEVKTQSEGDLSWLNAHFPYRYHSFATNKKGYSGTALFSKVEPEWVTYGFKSQEHGDKEFHYEGRIITAKYAGYIAITVYCPNSQEKLARLSERLEWEATLRLYLAHLKEVHGVPIFLCGDLNVAHREIDLHNPKANKKSAGFSLEEREAFQKMLDAGFVDSFRHLHPDDIAYTYWSNFAKSRERNVGWRIDYVLVSDAVKDRIRETRCLSEYMGSDHCPVSIVMDL